MAIEHTSWTALCREAVAASMATGVRRSSMGQRGGRTVSRTVCHISEASSSMAGSKVRSKGGGTEARGVAASHQMHTPQWWEPKDASQWKEGGERVPRWLAAKLCQVKSNVLGHPGAGLWRVTVPGGVWSSRPSEVAHNSKAATPGDRGTSGGTRRENGG